MIELFSCLVVITVFEYVHYWNLDADIVAIILISHLNCLAYRKIFR